MSPRRVVVQAEVQDGVHHARHGELRARADGDEQRVVGIAKALARLRFEVLKRREDLVPHALRGTSPSAVVGVAGFGGDREPWGTGSPLWSFRRACALAAEQVAH